MKYKIIITILTLLVPVIWCIFLGSVTVPLFKDEWDLLDEDELEITPEKETEENESTK